MSNPNQQSRTFTFAEMRANALANRVKSDEPRARTTSADVPAAVAAAGLSAIQLPVIPPTPKKLDNDDVKNLLAPLRIAGLVLPSGALERDRLDVRAVTKNGRKTATFSTNEMTFSNFGKDGEMFNALRTVPSDLHPELMDHYIADLQKSVGYIGSSGSMSGLLTRLVVGLTEAPRVGVHLKDAVRWASKVLSYHPVDIDYRGKGIIEVLEDGDLALKFNWNSSAGIPYYKKISDGDVFEAATEVASEMLNSIARGTFNNLVTEMRPSLMAVMLKNKQDYYPVDRLHDKIRPYFVFPFHERLLYSALQARLKAVRFDEQPHSNSGSAVGFSWNYGGGDKLYDWIVGKIGSGPGFYPLFYGDDQLWVIVTVDGRAYVCTPDFSHMDLSLSEGWGPVAYKMWESAFTKLDKTWKTVLKLNCKRAFTRQVIVESSMCFLFKHGMASGVPGTTKFDEVASAAVNGYIQERYQAEMNDITDPGLLGSFLFNIGKDVKRMFGLIFKEGSFVLHPFKPEMPSYDFEFLGQTLVRVAGNEHMHYIPKPAQWKLMLAATTYKKSYKSPIIKQKCAMSRYRSLYAGGGFLHPIFAARVKTVYGSMLARGLRPMGEDDEDWVQESETSVFVDIVFDKDDKEFPTSEFCFNLYLPVDDQIHEDRAITVGERLTSEPGDLGKLAIPDVGLGGFTSESEEEDKDEQLREKLHSALHPKDWGAQEALERDPQDAGVEFFQQPREVPAKFMEGRQPLPEEAKRKFEQEQAEARQLLREQRTLSQGGKGVKSAAKDYKDSRRNPGSMRRTKGVSAEDFELEEEEEYSEVD